MSGLFLNFYQVDISTKDIAIDTVEYSNYASKEAFKALKDSFSNLSFYRDDDKILLWKLSDNVILPENSITINIDLTKKAKVLSKILERSIIDFIEPKGYKIFKNKYSNAWEIISPKDILNGIIEGLTVNRIVHFSPCFFSKEDKLLLGFSLSTSLKNTFTWSKADFEKYGIDIKGLKSDEERIFANRQSLKRFLDTKGATTKYDQIVNEENKNAKAFLVIDGFYKWLDKNKAEIKLPFGLTLKSISKKYLPFENELIKAEIISKPQRYFYSNRKNTQGLRYYDQMVKAYQPYSLELYQNKQIKIGIICPSEYQGETEGFIRKTEAKLKEVFHFKSLSFHFKSINNKD